MRCTRCSGDGFLNLDQVDEDTLKKFEASGDHEVILDWIITQNRTNGYGCSCHIAPPCGACLAAHDVSVCDCCGDGEGWYGTPGQHNYTRHGEEPIPGCA